MPCAEWSRDACLQFAWAAPELLLGARCTEKVDVSACSPVHCARAHCMMDPVLGAMLGILA